MERVQTIIHKGKNIILIDLSRCPTEETLQVFPLAAAAVRTGPPKSQLLLTDVTEAIYNKAVSDGMKDLVAGNTPFVKASAIVGADGVRLVLLQTIVFLTRRDLKTFNTRAEALDYLAAQG